MNNIYHKTIGADVKPLSFTEWHLRLRLAKCETQATIAAHILGAAFKTEHKILNSKQK